MDDLVSVVIPNYNGAKFIEETIMSVCNQTYKTFEIIVVNDGSTDNSMAVLTQLQKKFDKLRVINVENGGVSKARNIGIDNAKGAYVAFLDSDDLWKKEYLQNHINAIKKHNCDLVYSNYTWFNEAAEFMNEKANLNPQSLFDFWVDSMLAPSSVTIKKECFNRLGGWDEKLYACEDMDLWFRLKLANMTIVSTHSTDVRIRIHETSAKTNFNKMYEGHILSLQKWSALLSSDVKKTIGYRNAVKQKLNKTRYYANMMGDRNKVKTTFILGFKLLGYKYVDNLLVSQLYRFIIKK
ncbi:glycosyltransferase family 2 protein [Winogradskyella arenosi]|uniref:Glycosyltransferase involved in cell wall biosynthesis n=1 Tax=Winogradskyella arenosi TaxID=533325 RepID=A0A368ZBM1_9FLAO|nr:glycosyltransferase family A protein [Winogradskyella arenosi]RCW90261.1 glycosyltransferase involved in cell wall biosynthesis [Winogradskyella arenosi]